MGKDKKGQRTKGNTKPSSSGRSAELLGGVTNFVGFSSLTDLGYVPAATQASVEDDSQISAEFRVTLRKMSKKDSVTKIKALQEFENLCCSEDLESIKTTLPFWPRLFAKLSVDCDRRVRENTHSAHTALVSQIGKNLAPYLRSIMPSWLLSMKDPHVPAATAATKSFQGAFTEEKRPGVMIFCSKEIIDTIYDNLLIQSSQTMSDPRITDKDDQESKYERVLYCSLGGLGHLLMSISTLQDKKGEINAKIQPLVQEDKFWKLAKHESSMVKYAWFDTISTILKYDATILKEHTEKLSRLIFAAMDYQDAFVVPRVWLAFLQLCVQLPASWKYCENPQSFFKRIFSVLHSGGKGYMCELSLQLLPMIVIVPMWASKEPVNFYIDFLRAVSTSLRNKKVLMDKREVSSIIAGLFECLKYLSKEQGSNQQLWDTIMKYQVVELVLSTFTDTPQLAESNLYHELFKLLSYWANTLDNNGANCNLNKLELFWMQVLPEFETWIKNGDDEKICKLKRFFTFMKDPNSVAAKKSKGVRFNDESRELFTTILDLDSGVNNQNDNYALSIAGSISPLIKSCFIAYKDNKNPSVYSLFACLLYSYSSENVYKDLVEKDSANAKVIFLEEFILPLMSDADQQTPVDISIDIFMFIYVQLNQEEQKLILLNLKPSLKIAALKILVEKMTDRSENDGVASLWLKSSPLGARLIQCLQRLCAITLARGSMESPCVKEEHSCLNELISFVMSNGYKDHVVFSLEYQSQLLKIIKTIFMELQSRKITEKEDNHCTTDCLDHLISLLNLLLDSSIQSKVNGLEDLLKYFYDILLGLPKIFSEEIEIKIKECFLKGFELNLIENISPNLEDMFKNQDLLNYVINNTKASVMDDRCTFAKTIELSALMEEIIIIMYKSSPLKDDCEIMLDHSIIQPTLDKLLPTEFEWSNLEEKLSPLYVTPSILFGSFICREFPIPLNTKEVPEWSQCYIRMSLFAVKIILSLSKDLPSAFEDDCMPKENDDVNKEKDDVSKENETIYLGQFTPLVVVALHGACHSSAVIQMNTFLNNNSVSLDIKLGADDLAASMKTLLGRVNEGNKKLIVKHIRDRCLHGNSFWCVTLGHVLSTWIKVPINGSKLISDLNENALGFTQTNQILLPYLNEVAVLDLLSEETIKLFTLSEDPYSALPSVCLITSALEYLSSSSYKSNKESIVFQQLETAIHTTFTTLVKWRDDAADIFLFASDLSDVAWEDVSVMVSIIRLLTVIVKSHSIHLLHSHWDVTLCALSAWVQSLLEVVQFPESSTVVAMFATACCKCASVVSELLLKIKNDSKLKSEYPPTLVEEWREFFAPSIFNTLILKFVNCAEVYEHERNVILYSLTRSLALSVDNMETSVIKEVSLPPRFNVDDDGNAFTLPDNLQTFLNHLSPLLLLNHPQGQCATYNVIKVALPEIMLAWEQNTLNLDEDEDLPHRPLPHSIMNIIKEADPVVQIALIDGEIGTDLEIVPYTDEYTCTCGYLLAWLLALTAITHGEESNQQLYASYIRDSNLLINLLNNIFKLMPSKPSLSENQSSKQEVTMFNSPLIVSACNKVSSEFISRLACQLYMCCLSQLPAAVRNWFTNLDRKTQQIVDKFTSTHVSPILISNEINTINESTVKYDNMTVKSRPGAREIIATYTIDEASMELILRMAPNYPLSTVTLEDHKRVGVSIAQWRNWLFGLNTMLSHRNTSLLNSLEFWKKNVDQKFEGIEECFICYYVLHGNGSHQQIPKLLCRTCKKKFHSACLFKWFNTSNNSTCPICRSLF